ncbi:MAG TPA: hypothetical protein VNQ31_07080 [Sphingomonadaceae bacterium]|nr:hypothetical protein [Sphingomonadaceae bacterium]
MRTVSDDAAVRLYHLGDGLEGGAATLLYGSLADALRLAAQQPAAIQADLFVQTSNDIVAYLDLIEG